MLDDLSIAKKLALGFGLVLVLVGCVAVTGWQYSRLMADEFDSLYTENLQSSVHLANAERGMWELRFGIANYIAATPEVRAKIRADEGKSFQLVEESLRAYRSGVRTQAEQQGLQEFDSYYGQYVNARGTWFALIDAGKLEEAARFRAANTNRFAGASVKALAHLIDLQNDLGAARQQQARSRDHLYAFVLAGVMLLAGLVALFVLSRLHRMIIGPLRKMIEATRNIGDSGDLDQEVELGRKDEIGELASPTARAKRYGMGLPAWTRPPRD